MIWTQPLVGAEAVCCDKVGQDAAREGLTKLAIHDVASNNAIKLEFKDGVLTGYMNVADGADGAPGDGAFQEILKSNLQPHGAGLILAKRSVQCGRPP